KDVGLMSYYLLVLSKGALGRGLSERTSLLTCTAVFSWISVVLASIACSFELSISGTVPLGTVLPAMVGVHAIIGVGEAIITTVVIAVVLQSRPDLVDAYSRSPEPGKRLAREVA
ncbi:MAG: energy-coupling factor ABC transporter permease, partial [Actinobacteria bacterium]|nr:energy-coupling factor ABC transporter permease [Actinomycetota bacterium]